jgi:hypothetical protein
MGTLGVALTTVDPADQAPLMQAVRARTREQSLRPDGGLRDPMLAARLRLHDEDRDGRVTLDEVPESSREAFSRVDTDGDGVVDASELAEFE